MSSRAGKILFRFILHLLVGTLIADENHICKRIMAGEFDRIRINSITLDTYKVKGGKYQQDLRIYESNGRLYRVAMDSEVRENTINMEGVARETYDVGGDADSSGYSKQYFAKSFAGVDEDPSSLKAVYHFQVKNFLVKKHAFFFFSQSGYKMYQFKIWWWPDGIAWEKPMNFYANELAIAHNQKGNSVTMYAIHRDLYNGTNDFIIYQIWLLNGDLTLNSLEEKSTDDQIKASAWFWYFEKTYNPSNVKLANRMLNNHNRDPSHQLFRKQPVGFLHSTNDQLYLFDQSLGCVYRLSNWSEESLSGERMLEGKDLYFKRENIPYERYFQCDLRVYPKAADFDRKHYYDRCMTYIGRADPGDARNEYEQPLPVIPRANEKELPIAWISVGVGSLILVLLFVGVVLLKNDSPDRKDYSKVSSVANSEATVCDTTSFKGMDSSKAASTNANLANTSRTKGGSAPSTPTTLTNQVSRHGKMALTPRTWNTSKGNSPAHKSKVSKKSYSKSVSPAVSAKTRTPSSAKKVRLASKH